MIDAKTILSIVTEGLKLTGKDSPAVQLIVGKLAERVDARSKAAIEKEMATARGERKAAHAGLQAGARGDR